MQLCRYQGITCLTSIVGCELAIVAKVSASRGNGSGYDFANQLLSGFKGTGGGGGTGFLAYLRRPQIPNVRSFGGFNFIGFHDHEFYD